MSYYDNGFARAQAMYDRQEPPEVYDFPYCQETTYIFGIDFENDLLPLVKSWEMPCRFCPQKHSCKDGIAQITSYREGAKENLYWKIESMKEKYYKWVQRRDEMYGFDSWENGWGTGTLRNSPEYFAAVKAEEEKCEEMLRNYVDPF